MAQGQIACELQGPHFDRERIMKFATMGAGAEELEASARDVSHLEAAARETYGKSEGDSRMSREVAGGAAGRSLTLSALRGQWSAASSQYSIYLILVAMIVISSFLSPAFLSVNNFANISRQISITTILAFGETILIIGGMLDLSCGSVMALSGLLAVLVFKATGFGVVALAAGVVTGVVANYINAFMVTAFRLPPFIATLAMLTSARGAALLLTSGQPVYQLGKLQGLGPGRRARNSDAPPVRRRCPRHHLVHPQPHPSRAIHLRDRRQRGGGQGVRYRHQSRQGRRLPDQRRVRRDRGRPVHVARERRPAGRRPGFELDALTSSIIGGVSFSGGVGTAVGTLAGAFIVGFLGNIMNLLGIQSYVQQVVRGAIIALAVAYDIASKSRRTRKILGAPAGEAGQGGRKKTNE